MVMEEKKEAVKEIVDALSEAVDASMGKGHGFVSAYIVVETAEGNFCRYTTADGLEMHVRAEARYAEDD